MVNCAGALWDSENAKDSISELKSCCPETAQCLASASIKAATENWHWEESWLVKGKKKQEFQKTAVGDGGAEQRELGEQGCVCLSLGSRTARIPQHAGNSPTCGIQLGVLGLAPTMQQHLF